MFDLLELTIGQDFDMDIIINNLVVLRYIKRKSVSQEGEFSTKGEILIIYPANFDSPIRIDFDFNTISSIATINLITYKSVWKHRTIRIPAHYKNRKDSIFSKDIPVNTFVDISKGDYVVHNQHGIGRFLGYDRVLSDTVENTKHCVIEYSGGDKLYVPEYDLKLVQKYVGFTKKPPRLYKLGNKEWVRIKKNITERLKRLAGELLHTQAVRASMKGFSFSKDTKWQEDFEEGFPFEETADQIRASFEIKEDMNSIQPMDRLLCGDVGYGKTEVVMRAVFKAVMDNKQVVILVPTTILAKQHYYNFTIRLRNFPVKVSMLSRFSTKKEQNEIIKELDEGKVDVVIGTHRLLSNDIVLKDLGLIVIDEEHRFGVRSKEKLKHLRLVADVLTLSATPIPRTLHMALTGVKDMSIISTPPSNRLSVITEIIEFDEDFIKGSISRELRRKGQVFFLHNRVEDIDCIATVIRRLHPNASVEVGHGQMSSKSLEKVMLGFLKGTIDILVCTTIIESGIDIPNANTLIINRADRFGLSELHQLRGRVGRSKIQAYTYLIIPPKYKLSSIAKIRIDAIKKFSGLGSGFHIAFEDLQLRGTGNILGQEQSGYITSIGFDLYCRLLKESVDKLRKKQEMETYEKSN